MIIRHKSFDTTVDTVEERNNLPYKVDHMVVLVKDAIADVDAGAGAATYKWSSALDRWLLISKSTIDTMSFETVELTVVAGKVIPLNVPVNNIIWDIFVIEGDTILHELRLSDIIVSATSISGLEAYEGKNLRFTYAYGTVTQQIESYMNEKITTLTGLAPINLDTFKEVSDKIATIENNVDTATVNTGTVDDFEGWLV